MMTSNPYIENVYRATVMSHHDGDTSRLLVDPGFDLGIKMTIRWDGLDAPELGTDAGKAALAWLNARLPSGTLVVLQTVKDRKEKYGRYLATVFDVNGRNVNADLLASGHAVPYDGGARG